MPRPSPFVWREIVFPQPLGEESALEAIRRLADDPSEPALILEVRATRERTQFVLGADVRALPRIANALGVAVVDEPVDRSPIDVARSVRLSTPRLGFGRDRLDISSAGLLEALHGVRRGEEAAIQLVLGARRRAESVSSQTTAPQSMAAILNGTPARKLERGELEGLTHKRGQPGFRAALRLGVAAKNSERRRTLLLGIYTAMRRLETADLHLRLTPQKPSALDAGSSSWRLPLHLSIREAAAVIALPVGKGNLAGLPPAHPRALAPRLPLAKAGEGRIVVGSPTAPGTTGVLTLSLEAVLRGVHLFGPPGVGKSELAGSLALQWINQGNAAVIVEPKTDLSDSIVSRIDASEQHRIVYLDLTAESIIGLNPLSLNGRAPELVADGILTVFGSIFSDVLGVRTRDVVHSAVLSLVQYPGATLVMLPPLLTDRTFRRKVVGVVADDPVLAGFWAWYDALSEQSQSQIVGPVLSRLRQVLLRKTLRNALGQASPKFDIRQVFGPEKKVLVVPLPEAQLGKEGAKLFGSLVLHEVFTAVKERATVAPDKRDPVMVVVDEFQKYVATMSDDFGEALAIFRGYGCGLVMANQLLAQLPKELRSVVLGAIRSRVYFQLAPEDAHALSRWTEDLEASDFQALEPFHMYASLYDHGATRPFISGQTIQLEKPTTSVERIKAESGTRYGMPVADIDAEFARLSGLTSSTEQAGAAPITNNPSEAIGRRKRRTNHE
jgi:hypothetical protein